MIGTRAATTTAPTDANARRRHDLIVLDPPWENASAHRAHAYPTLPHRRLLQLPLPQLMAPNALVALWVTTRPKLRRVVEQELLPAWGLRLLRVWWWLKVNADGSPVCPLVRTACVHDTLPVCVSLTIG
jgi:N6-adenosine-specific RNA methylase IME4